MSSRPNGVTLRQKLYGCLRERQGTSHITSATGSANKKQISTAETFYEEPSLVLDDDVAEEEATRFADGTQTALEARAEELLRAAAVDHEETQTRRDLPDMLEGDHGKLAAPAQRQREAA